MLLTSAMFWTRNFLSLPHELQGIFVQIIPIVIILIDSSFHNLLLGRQDLKLLIKDCYIANYIESPTQSWPDLLIVWWLYWNKLQNQWNLMDKL